MKFKSKKDIFISFVVFGINFFLIGITIVGFFNGELAEDEYWTIIPISAVIFLLFWIYFGTSYELNNEYFAYYSGPFRGKISINRIKEVLVGTTVYVGMKPATATKGILIKYDKFEDIYISPATNETFVKKLLEIKKDIIVNKA